MNEFSKTGLKHENARTEEQKKLMAQIEQDGVCPFCSEHFRRYHPKPILKESDFWFVTENMSPYEGTAQHFLFVYKPQHVTHLEDIDKEALADLLILTQWVTSTYSIDGASLFMRFGNTERNGSSVAHLHAQLIVGGKQSDGKEPIKVKLGWKI